MLSIGLTGGIASGKSLLSTRFRALGAVVIDADKLARDVVEPGTAGLAEIVDAFGDGILLPDGSLDRPALGALVFADSGKRETLNGIIHPRVRAAAGELKAAALPGQIVVQDIPLLVETGQGAAFHLVVVVDAPAEQRLARMVANRGMSESDARARMAAQAGDAQRYAAADVVIANGGEPGDAIAAIDALWRERLEPFAQNLAEGRRAPQHGPAVMAAPDPSWPAQASRLAARIKLAAGDTGVGVDHIGSTSVAGLAAKDIIDLQLRVRSLADADSVAEALAVAGFPACDGDWWDTGHDIAGGKAGERWEKRFHNAADPGRPVNLHVRVDGSPAALMAVAFRDWLRADFGARASYETVKRGLAADHAGDSSTAGYAEAKEPWFARMVPDLRAWMARTGWRA
ncbi:dephospho-CoA kinase [Arthrobacter sp. ERGS1:01]|uniref:dephospho-CoA kinase n=1 Tax=Arthrobacter sp. ERGS1:01 TaxID=1704044 RepID=UPI0006B5ACB0|nr:dephospho-CoA kinase [Arthrobacter sp. ERGS1:01]ALE05910.1 dephospho-CoA kinase [Arthrobacter sp. ERGS1:01]